MAERTFDSWRQEFEAELKRRTNMTWADASGDLAPLQDYFSRNEPVSETVDWYIEKYDLEDVAADPYVWG